MKKIKPKVIKGYKEPKNIIGNGYNIYIEPEEYYNTKVFNPEKYIVVDNSTDESLLSNEYSNEQCEVNYTSDDFKEFIINLLKGFKFCIPVMLLVIIDSKYEDILNWLGQYLDLALYQDIIKLICDSIPVLSMSVMFVNGIVNFMKSINNSK